MRKYYSVLSLYTRNTIYKLLLIIAGTGVADVLLFARAWSSSEGDRYLDWLLSDSHLNIVALIGFTALCAILIKTGLGTGSKQEYTFSRLSVTQHEIFILQAVNNIGLFFIFWASQVAIILGLCAFFTYHYPQPQVTMLVFYQQDFLHNLIPLAETTKWILNICLVLALGLTSASHSVKTRLGRQPVAFIFIVGLCVYSFMMSIANPVFNVVASILTVIVTIGSLDLLREELTIK